MGEMPRPRFPLLPLKLSFKCSEGDVQSHQEGKSYEGLINCTEGLGYPETKMRCDQGKIMIATSASGIPLPKLLFDAGLSQRVDAVELQQAVHLLPGDGPIGLRDLHPVVASDRR